MPDNSTERLEAVGKVIESIKSGYPDITELEINIDFEFVETSDGSVDPQLTPVVRIKLKK